MSHSIRIFSYQKGISSIWNISFVARHLSGYSGIPPGLTKKLIKEEGTKFSIPDLQKSLSLGRNLGQVKLNPDDFFDMITDVKIKTIPDNYDINKLIEVMDDIKQDSDMKIDKGEKISEAH